MKRKIFFRADASTKIGYGHFVRTLALADMLKDNFDCTFFTQNPTRFQINEVGEVCKLISLPADDSKFGKFLSYIEGNECIVLDNYFYSTEYQQIIKNKGCKLVCIDDIRDKHYVADVVINHAPGFTYDDFDIEPYTKLCIGLEWGLLRNDFLYVDNSAKRSNAIFICIGGTDQFNLTPKMINNSLRAIENIEIHAVVGDGYKFKENLIKDYQHIPNIHIHSLLSSKEMKNLMQYCKMGIVPASSVLWECIRIGLPTLYGYYVDNQIEICNRNPYIHNSVCIGDMLNISDTELISQISLKYNEKYISVNKVTDIKSNYCKLFSDLFKWSASVH